MAIFLNGSAIRNSLQGLPQKLLPETQEVQKLQAYYRNDFNLILKEAA